MGTPGKRVWVQAHRRFESCPLRHFFRSAALWTVLRGDSAGRVPAFSTYRVLCDTATCHMSFEWAIIPRMEDIKYWVAFHQISGIGPATFAKLEARFGDLESAWRAPVSDLIAAGVKPKVAAEAGRFRDANEPDEVMGTLDRLDIKALHLRHPDYPARLAETPLAPSVIYLKSSSGTMLPADEQAIAVIGSRDATPYGFEMTRRISYDLARAGVTIVSGLARGIDSAAHKAALEAGGRTIAVLSSGLDQGVSATEHPDRRQDCSEWCPADRVPARGECAP